MQSFSLKCFGVGDGAACGDRNHSSYLYDLGEVCLLLDCGEPVSRSFKAAGLSYDKIDHLFISHLHSDHFAGLFMLLQGTWLERRRKDLIVHLPADGIEPVRQMLKAAFLFDELLPFRLILEPLRAAQPVRHGPVRVTAYPTSHLDGLRKSFQSKYPGDYAAYCFLIETGEFRIGHSADLGSPQDLEPLLTEPLDLLVCELAHFKPEHLFDYLKGRKIKRIAFVHLGRSYWEGLEEVRRLAAKVLPDVKSSFPLDQDVITLS